MGMKKKQQCKMVSKPSNQAPNLMDVEHVDILILEVKQVISESHRKIVELKGIRQDVQAVMHRISDMERATFKDAESSVSESSATITNKSNNKRLGNDNSEPLFNVLIKLLQKKSSPISASDAANLIWKSSYKTESPNINAFKNVIYQNFRQHMGKNGSSKIFKKHKSGSRNVKFSLYSNYKD